MHQWKSKQGRQSVSEYIGKTFGKRLVLREAGRDKSRDRLYLCRCECGKEDLVRQSSLRIGKSIMCHSCAAKITRNKRTHELSGTRLYAIWKGMIRRCRDKSFKAYAARGIKVCEEWLDTRAFHQWAFANGYADDLTIDRINVDLGYSPENCRWIPKANQTENVQLLTASNKSGYRGVSKKSGRDVWLARIKIDGKIIHLGHHKDPVAAAMAHDRFIADNGIKRPMNFKIFTDKAEGAQRQEQRAIVRTIVPAR